MTEQLITVSDSEAFYRIPVSDLEEAHADGFYLPLIHNRTIVSDGEQLFEVPVSDLMDAEADGFSDILGSEQSLVYQLRDAGHVAAMVSLSDESAEVDDDEFEPQQHHAEVDEPSSDTLDTINGSADSEATINIAAGVAAVAASADPHSIFDDEAETFDADTIASGQAFAEDTINAADDTIDETIGDTDDDDLEFEDPPAIDAAMFDDLADSPGSQFIDAPSGADLEIESEEEEEQEELPLYKKILGIGPDGGRTWGVLSLNTGLHAVALLLLAMVILPSNEKEEFMTIASSVIAAETPKELDIQAMDIEQPAEEVEDVQTAESPIDTMVDSLDPMDIDISDAALAAPAETESMAPGKPAAKMTGEMGGRSKAGRAQMVAKMGGTAASEAAVHEGLNWVARHQLNDGGWSFNHVAGQKACDCTSPGSLVSDCRNAATGMAILAMLGAGNTPFEGNFTPEMQRGVQFMIRNAQATPAGVDFRGQHANNTGMYTHAIATTAMCEVLAMIEAEYKRDMPDRSKRGLNVRRKKVATQLRPICQAATNFIVNAQYGPDGGWGYDPQKPGDTSILGWQVMALKSAKHAHIPFPGRTVAAANRFLNRVQDNDGRYGYRDAKSKKPSTTAIGIVCRMLSGMSRTNPLMRRGVSYLSTVGPDPQNMYFNYYATQVMLNYGGDTWTKWNDVMRDRLVKSQIKTGHASGSWNLADKHGAKGGRLYMTALCVMTLEVYYRHLPLYGNQNNDEEMAEATPAKKSEREKRKERADARKAAAKKALMDTDKPAGEAKAGDKKTNDKTTSDSKAADGMSAEMPPKTESEPATN